MAERIKTYNEFYKFYLTEHANGVSRNLHFIGTSFVFLIPIWAIYQNNYNWLYLIPVVAYGFAWVGHFFFEKNKPATFQYPLWSLISDFRMYYHFLTGQLKKKLEEAQKAFPSN